MTISSPAASSDALALPRRGGHLAGASALVPFFQSVGSLSPTHGAAGAVSPQHSQSVASNPRCFGCHSQDVRLIERNLWICGACNARFIYGNTAGRVQGNVPLPAARTSLGAERIQKHTGSTIINSGGRAMHAIKQSVIDATFVAAFIVISASPFIAVLIIFGMFD